MTDTMHNNEMKQTRRKYIITGGLFVLLIMSVLIFIIFSQNQKPDPASEAIIRKLVSINLYSETIMETDPNSLIIIYPFPELAIDPNKLTDEDFLKIEGLSLGYPNPSFDESNLSMELCDIKLLKKFTNLKRFKIGAIRYPSNKIPRWMSLLAKLGIFNLEDRFALDLSPLKKLKKLENMIIYDTTVKNIKTLENLNNLRELSIDNTNISDLEPLKELKNLKTLHISNCKKITDEQIEDLQKALPELKIYR